MYGAKKIIFFIFNENLKLPKDKLLTLSTSWLEKF
jgi:hypothetical protein